MFVFGDCSFGAVVGVFVSKPFYVNPRYQDNIEKPTDFIMVKVVLFEDYERLSEALEKFLQIYKAKGGYMNNDLDYIRQLAQQALQEGEL